MAVLDRLKRKELQGLKIPPDVRDRLERGRKEKDKDATLRRLCVKFWQGGPGQYYYLDAKGQLANQATVTDWASGRGKPPHRIRNAYDFAHSIIQGKVSASTQRVPGYEITPSTDDPEDEAAASLAGQVAAFGYDKWRLRRATTKCFTNAFVQREGFAMPYFDPNVGPFTQDEDGEWRGQGEVKIWTGSRSKVMWEPGEDFDDSRWHAIEYARLIEDVQQIPGFVGGDLKADAQTKDLPNEADTYDTHVIFTDFMERPCPKYPQGRRFFICNDVIVVDQRLVDPDAEVPWEPHPVMDANDQAVDEPAIHRISYTVNPEGDDTGLMEHLIDLARTVNDCWNKLLEWKNRCLMPRMMAPVNSLTTRPDDIPGGIDYYNPMGQNKPEWEKPPQIPTELFNMLDLAIQHMRAIAADIDVQPDPDLAAKTASAAIQQSEARWQSFLGDAAEFHSRLMRHCLTLVARFYDEQRQIDIRGQYGWQPVQAFSGQDLRSQVNVRVLPGSLETKSRQAIQQEIQFIQANWPGAISPEAALSTLHGGSAEGLLRSYQNDVARAWRVVRRLKAYTPESFGTHFDPNVPNLQTGQMGVDVPNWMPREWDNIQIWRQIIGDYMKTEDFERQSEDVQHRFELVWSGLEAAEQMRAAKQAAQQQMQAESLGMANAGKDQLPPPLPDRAGFTPDNQSPAEAPA